MELKTSKIPVGDRLDAIDGRIKAIEQYVLENMEKDSSADPHSSPASCIPSKGVRLDNPHPAL